VLVGTDAPALSRRDVRNALAFLHDHDLVLGPAADGGYYLVALSRPCADLFRGVPWSTPSVFTTTTRRAGELGMAVRVLRVASDVDTLEDVRTHWGRLRLLLDPGLARAVEDRLGLPPSS
jgi:glycosyltransferase A (GT-A) superfamily protein (DUF2064 family)